MKHTKASKASKTSQVSATQTVSTVSTVSKASKTTHNADILEWFDILKLDYLIKLKEYETQAVQKLSEIQNPTRNDEVQKVVVKFNASTAVEMLNEAFEVLKAKEHMTPSEHFQLALYTVFKCNELLFKLRLPLMVNLLPKNIKGNEVSDEFNKVLDGSNEIDEAVSKAEYLCNFDMIEQYQKAMQSQMAQKGNQSY